MDRCATPPHDAQAERELLGLLLIAEPHATAVRDHILRTLEPEDFYVTAHRILYVLIRDLLAANVPLDTITLAAEAERVGQLTAVGGRAGIAALLEAVWLDTRAEPRLWRVRQCAALRQAIACYHRLQEACYVPGATIEQILDAQERMIRRVRARWAAPPAAPIGLMPVEEVTTR